jgi:hypothetical protein
MPTDPQLPLVFNRGQARAAGITDNQADRRVAGGRWQTLARGVYCLTSTWQAAKPEGRQILVAQASLTSADYPAFASHASGAALFGLPVPTDLPGWLTRLPPGSTRYGPWLNVEVATVPSRDQREIDGIPVTSLRRTVADCLRHLQPRDGLAVADAALHRVPGLLPAVADVLEQCAEWPYAARAARLLPLVDGRRESPLESWSFLYFVAHELPLPEPQVELFDEHGNFLGRVDDWWDDWNLAGEADGKSKYAVPDGLTIDAAQQLLHEEKRREDGIRQHGVDVVRWGARDLFDDRLANVIRAKTSTKPKVRFQGHARPYVPALGRPPLLA